MWPRDSLPAHAQKIRVKQHKPAILPADGTLLKADVLMDKMLAVRIDHDRPVRFPVVAHSQSSLASFRASIISW